MTPHGPLYWLCLVVMLVVTYVGVLIVFFGIVGLGTLL
jgi:hypothetical protein